MNQATIQKASIESDITIQIQIPLLPTSALVELSETLEAPLVKNVFLTNLIGKAQGSFKVHSEADDFISAVRNDWCY